ncbi:plastocyanin/azurin family copper-binding protein [uncultured Thermus sp.]|uniref:plastocyanin/azurin family copper-binding protein n=1 Tax=uncultured Thermus sp. TaxID=157149 RepID=UPI003416B5CF
MRILWIGFSAALVLAGCYPRTGGGNGALEACPSVIQIQGFSFHPASCFVALGGSLSFENHDAAPHTATADGGAFDTGTLNQGQTSTPITFNQAGIYTYFCRIHPGMRGEIEVR